MTIRDTDKTKNVRGQKAGQNQKNLVLSVPKIKDKTKKILSLKMSEGHRDKTKNVSKKSLNHAGLSGLGTKPKMSEKTGTKLGTENNIYSYIIFGKCPNWSMGT